MAKRLGEKIALTDEERAALDGIILRGGKAADLAAILLAADRGVPSSAIAARLGVTKQAVISRVNGFLGKGRLACPGLGGPRVKPPGRPRIVSAETKKCSRCGERKPVAEFHPRSRAVTPRTTSDYANLCKRCDAMRMRYKQYRGQVDKDGVDEVIRQTRSEIARLQEKLEWLYATRATPPGGDAAP